MGSWHGSIFQEEASRLTYSSSTKPARGAVFQAEGRAKGVQPEFTDEAEEPGKAMLSLQTVAAVTSPWQ